MRPIPRPRAAVAVVAAVVLATACGSSGPDGDSGALDPQQPTTIKVGEVVGIPAAFLSYGQNNGYFERHGLDLDIDSGAGGAAIIPGVVSGDYAVGGSNVVSVVLAAKEGVPITMVAPGTFAQDSRDQDFGAILVPPDGDVDAPADLAGKTIAINTLRNITELTATITLENHGVDPSTVKYTEVGFPEMLAVLDRGSVDAVWAIEPFVTQGLRQGLEPIAWPYLETKVGMQVGSYVTTKQYLSERPEVVEAFQAGVADTAAAIADDPEAFRAALPELTELSPQAARDVILPQWKANVDRGTVELLDEQMVEHGLTDGPVDLDELLAPGAVG